MNLEHINYGSISVKFRGGRDYAKIYNSDKRLCISLRNTRISKVSTNSMYLLLSSTDIEHIQALEKHIEDEIVKSGLSSEYTLNSNIFMNSHNQLYYKVRYSSSDTHIKDTFNENKTYDIDVKAYYLAIKENRTIEMEVWVSNTSDIREIVVSESEDEKSESSDDDYEDDIGPSPEEILNMKNEVLHKLSVSIMEKDLEIDQLKKQSIDMTKCHDKLKNETDLVKILRYINETEF